VVAKPRPATSPRPSIAQPAATPRSWSPCSRAQTMTPTAAKIPRIAAAVPAPAAIVATLSRCSRHRHSGASANVERAGGGSTGAAASASTTICD